VHKWKIQTGGGGFGISLISNPLALKYGKTTKVFFPQIHGHFTKSFGSDKGFDLIHIF
jgi:hypothetical protein|tara:strand:- start:455 stop:628 length:174 start_codon:yes stop_codon:yes gene_type:complete